MGRNISPINYVALFPTGMTHEDVMTFIRRLDKVMAARSKNNSKALHQVQTPSKTPTSNNVPTISVESNGSPGPKKLTYV